MSWNTLSKPKSLGERHYAQYCLLLVLTPHCIVLYLSQEWQICPTASIFLHNEAACASMCGVSVDLCGAVSSFMEFGEPKVVWLFPQFFNVASRVTDLVNHRNIIPETFSLNACLQNNPSTNYSTRLLFKSMTMVISTAMYGIYAFN